MSCWKASLRILLLALGSLSAFTFVSQAQEQPKFRFPLDCEIGKSCFLQNMIDLDPGEDVVDSLCNAATYNNHKGIDVRVRSLVDLNQGVAVHAIADGVVLGARDEMADNLLLDNERLASVKGRECGNGVAIKHRDGWSSQYCHMQFGSLRVKRGDQVKRGALLGNIGASGATQFPHLHLTLRQNDGLIDPLTGVRQNPHSCDRSADHILEKADTLPFGQKITASLLHSHSTVLDLGLSGQKVSLRKLVTQGKTALAKPDDDITLGWAWFINLHKGDQIEITILKDGEPYARQRSKPFDRAKAQWVSFTGRKRHPEAGDYEVSAKILRGGQNASSLTRNFKVK